MEGFYNTLRYLRGIAAQVQETRLEADSLARTHLLILILTLLSNKGIWHFDPTLIRVFVCLLGRRYSELNNA